MASAEKLLHEAQYAFHSIGRGATNAHKQTARATRLARQLVTKYPNSTEAAMARSILESLNDQPRAAISKLLKKPQTLEEVHVHDNSTRAPKARDKDSWSALRQRIVDLPHAKKKALILLIVLAAMFVAFLPILALAVFYYVAKPGLVKKHATTVLDVLHPESSS